MIKVTGLLQDGERVYWEFGTKKAAEKMQERLLAESFVRKSDTSFFGHKYKNIYQVIIK